MNFLRNIQKLKQSIINEYGLHALSYNVFSLIKDSMIILCDNIDIKKKIEKKFMIKFFLCILNYDFFY